MLDADDRPMAGAPLLSDDVIELMGSGVDGYVASRDAALEPESMLVMGIEPGADRASVTVFLPEKLAAATLANLRDNGAIAITLARASDLQTVQLKGRAVGFRACDERDRELLLSQRAAMVEQLAFVGVPRSASRRLVWWPCVGVEVRVTDVFTQTPGPRAGERITGASS
jgi:hypothetical protein